MDACVIACEDADDANEQKVFTVSSSEKANLSYSAANTGLGISRLFSDFTAGLQYEQLPEKVRHECKRGLLDWLGCALAGSDTDTVRRLKSALDATGSLPKVQVIGHANKMGVLEAALMNGQMGHVLDFDDTHMDGVVLHTSSPVLSALFSAATLVPCSGQDLMVAYALGFEAGVRIGKASPGHHDAGWHLTGTLGTLAAGMASARLLRLDGSQTNYALGIAATQSAGLQQNRGTMSKSFHAGKAAHNGLLAALLAREGFDSSTEIIEGRKGFSTTFAPRHESTAMTAQLGQTWEILSNGHKPYACGVVLHPLIDGVIALRSQIPDFGHIASIALQVNPITVRITGIEKPQTGLQSKFSLYHSAAVACLDGVASLAQYSDARAADPTVIALRDKVQVQAAEDFGRDEAHVCITLVDGTRLEHHVAHASGTQQNPMTDAALQIKFMANAVPVLGQARSEQLMQTVWTLDTCTDINALTALCALSA
jgi:2-methylcitrate dehydratase PrpD